MNNDKIRICRKCKNAYLETFEYFYKSNRHKDNIETLCKICYDERTKKAIKNRQLKYTNINGNTMKRCNKCQRLFLANSNYFWKNSKTADMLDRTCRECSGAKFVLNKEMIHEGYKKCGTCKKILPVGHYNKCNQNKDGLFFQCKECYSNYTKEYHKKNKDWVNKRDNLRSKVPERAKRTISYRERTKLEKKFYDKQYRQINKEKIYFEYSMKRRHLKKQLPATFTAKLWRSCMAHFDNVCCYCGKKVNSLTQDHFVALSKGGEYTKNNIVPVCAKCNSMKQHFDFFVWYPKQEFYSKKRENKILKYLNYNKTTKIQQLALDIV